MLSPESINLLRELIAVTVDPQDIEELNAYFRHTVRSI
jgi:hypothetical protein